MHTAFCSETLKRRVHLVHVFAYGMIILNLTLKKYCMRVWTGYIWYRIGSNTVCCEHGNELSDSIKGGLFLGLSRTPLSGIN
jgi:hypothetical protein